MIKNKLLCYVVYRKIGKKLGTFPIGDRIAQNVK